jgi:putative membrane protein
MNSETPRSDQLALQRTELANERTLLAYVRTALALIGGGLGLLEFVVADLARLSGWLAITAGAVLLPVGLWRYVAVRRSLRS